jgi:hypothetical protein
LSGLPAGGCGPDRGRHLCGDVIECGEFDWQCLLAAGVHGAGLRQDIA